MEFYGSNYTFYPLGFHPAFGHFTSDSPPAFLDNNLFTIMKDNMSHQNQGADILSLGFFQGYSNLKRSFRHRADDLLASQGVATAALAIPATEVNRGAYLRAKHQRLLGQLRGELTPENPGASTPFARERQRVEASMAEDEFAYRFEQVISIDAQRLVRERRNFGNVLRPIFQLIRLFLKEKQLYMGILRRFPPAVFPGVLTAFARTIELGIGEMDRRFRDSGSRGLGLALSEGVAALDRLGNFCFTGDPRVLPSRVLGPLGTMDSLRKCGWPYLCPRMLNLTKGRELIHLARWPKLNDDDRPILMHVASLAYHYGPTVAANRHSQIWFAELGGRAIDGLLGLTPFLEEVFRDLWVPETKAFVSHQLRCGLSHSLRGGVLPDKKESADKATITLTAWEEYTSSFTWFSKTSKKTSNKNEEGSKKTVANTNKKRAESNNKTRNNSTNNTNNQDKDLSKNLKDRMQNRVKLRSDAKNGKEAFDNSSDLGNESDNEDSIVSICHGPGPISLRLCRKTYLARARQGWEIIPQLRGT
ncbi:hypothetical protein AUP68_10374 [Ilyonectria robusta]